jgi:hypothetical protein
MYSQLSSVIFLTMSESVCNNDYEDDEGNNNDEEAVVVTVTGKTQTENELWPFSYLE